ncbi:hypothetical protein PY365_25300 [Roseiarcaceae bacterium H3SJ34-1]|uniref:lysozyme inhibitor LprI family protein n=1 Tax=Terripilifer ovatus TaxID=3032367 RepID=UPI003AB9665B|nr:hypothetical protein [Roseiarcaceae bacterium H3SJ34-1]
MIGKHVLALSLLMVALAPGAGHAQQARPSFDCAKARLDVEKEICASPELSQIDAGIAAAYATAQQSLDAGGKAALAASEKEFIATRNLGKVATTFDLKDHLQRRRDLLRAIRPSKGQWAGTWGIDNGSMTLALRSDGLYDVTARTDHPSGACDFEHGGKLAGNVMTTVHRSKEEQADDPHEGWTLTLTRAGDALKLKTHRGPDEKMPNPFCGVHGSLDGTWLPLQAKPEH